MTAYVVAPAAQADIEEIVEHIAAQDPRIAARFVTELYAAFDILAVNPDAGHRRRDLTDHPVLFWTVMRSFAVIYRKRKQVEIVRVVRWRRDVPTLPID